MQFLRTVAFGAALVCLAAGMAIILVQALWITYGVFVRYVLGSPDGTVTEATALLLVPLAFLGLPWALKEDAFPRVTFVTDGLAGKPAAFIEKFNLAIMVCVGLFFTAVSVNATVSSFRSGASSSVLSWPEYLFWLPVAVASVAFVVDGVHKLLSRIPAADAGE